MRIIIAYTVAVVFAAIYHCEMTNAQDCETERHLFMMSENISVNCSLAFSRVVDLVISRNDLFSISDLNVVCGTGSNSTHVCESGIMDYFTACRSTEAVSNQEKALSYGCTINPRSGSYCATNFTAPIYQSIRKRTGYYQYTTIPPLRELFDLCVRGYFEGRCYYSCSEFMKNYAQPSGCCYTEALKTFFADDSSVNADAYAIIANDYFTLCNLTHPGFCMDVPPPPSSSCSLSILELFQNNDKCGQLVHRLQAQRHTGYIITYHSHISEMLNIPKCLERYLAYVVNCDNITTSPTDAQITCLNSAIATFGQKSCWNSTDLLIRVTERWIADTSSFHEIIEIESASEIMCRSPECIDSFNDYITNCHTSDASNVTDLLCHRSSEASCLAVKQSGAVYSLVNSFYPFTGYGSSCLSTVISICSNPCRQIIIDSIDSAGCCAYEVLQYMINRYDLSQNYSADQVFTSCSVDNSRGCALITGDDSTMIGGTPVTTAKNSTSTSGGSEVTENDNNSTSGSDTVIAYVGTVGIFIVTSTILLK